MHTTHTRLIAFMLPASIESRCSLGFVEQLQGECAVGHGGTGTQRRGDERRLDDLLARRSGLLGVARAFSSPINFRSSLSW